MELVENQWDLESLEKAYRHGFMAGMVGKESDACPYRAEVIVNAWEAGWQDGREQFEIKLSARQQKLHS
jgi:ribosome modulation factor